MEFRRRDYRSEYEAHVLLRSRVDQHPLSTGSLSPTPLHNLQEVDEEADVDKRFFDPLRQPIQNLSVSINENRDLDNSYVSESSEEASHVTSKEWISFKRVLMQRFPVSKMISISSVSDAILKTCKVGINDSKTAAYQKPSSSRQPAELNDTEKSLEENTKVIFRHEYISRIHTFKDQIRRSWNAEDRVTALQLSIKVTRLLMDTSALQFYPTMFALITDVLDMLGDLVWERIKQKAEFTEGRSRICTLSENYRASDVCVDAKETCNNWFCKVGSVRKLLPRIYLELAILPCWRFLYDQPEECLQRLVMMTRGIADPLASSYCRLYMVQRAQKLSANDTGHLISCIKDVNVIMNQMMLSLTDSTYLTEEQNLIVSLMEPTIEYVITCILSDGSQRELGKILIELGIKKSNSELCGSSPCISIILYHLLKGLPTEVVLSNAMEILNAIRRAEDCSFDQCLNYRLLGFRLSEKRSQMEVINAVMDNIIQVVTQYDGLENYLKVLDAYTDAVLLNQMDDYLTYMLEGILKRVREQRNMEDEVETLQSIIMKLLHHFGELEDAFSLNHFLEILDVMCGTPCSLVNMHILSVATTKRNGPLSDPTLIKLLLKISRSLHGGMDIANVKDNDSLQPPRLITRFIQLVDHGEKMEQHLAFLIECRGNFAKIRELKEALVHSSNALAAKALKGAGSDHSLVKSCIAFSEVTIPSISAHVGQLNLYLETAEVALLAGLVSHADGLMASAISCLRDLKMEQDTQISMDIDGILSSIKKLLGLFIIVPGNPEQGTTSILKCILSLIGSTSWMIPSRRIRIWCGFVLLTATLSQNKLPYCVDNPEVVCNDMLFYGDICHSHELISLAEPLLQELINAIDQETSQVARGSMALEACNCIASSFKINEDIKTICYKLIETAKSCLSADDKFLQSTIKFLNMSFMSVGIQVS